MVRAQASIANRKSKVRAPLGLRQIRRGAVRLFGTILPGVAATWFENFFLTPVRHLSSNADASFSDGRATRIPYTGGSLSAWSWGEGPTVLLVHGWSGYAAQLKEFVEPLRAAGFRVVAFDAPAHGASDGQRTNLVEYAGAVLQVAIAVGPVHGIIAHSFGAPATALAVSFGFDTSRMVFIGPPLSLEHASQRVAEFLGVPPKVRDLMQRRVERWLGMPWKEMQTDHLIAKLDIPLLVFHDDGDREVPWRDGAVITRSAKHGRLVTMSGLGHRGILRDRGVVKQAVDFFGGGVPAAAELVDDIAVSAGEERPNGAVDDGGAP